MKQLTRDEPERFTICFNFLSLSKHFSHDDAQLEAAMLILGDVEISSVEHASRILAMESSSFMPDYGTWREIASEHALQSHTNETTEVLQIAPEGHLEDDEQRATKMARDAFLEAYETLAGKRLPSDHLWRSETIQLPHFSCPDCTDSGWIQHDCRTEDQCASCRLTGRHIYDHSYVDRCDCFASNPSLQAARIRSRYATTLSKNKRRH